MSINITNLKYTAKPLGLRFGIRLENWWIGVRDRKSAFKHFCHEYDIEYPLTSRHKNIFPTVHHVSSPWMDYLGKMRDRIIANQNTEYQKISEELRIAEDEIKGKKAEDEQYLAKLKLDLQATQKHLKSERAKAKKDHQDIIALEQRRESQKTQIANCTSDIETHISDLAKLSDLKQSNRAAWNEQVKIIQALTTQVAKKYTVYATKQIRNRLDYNKFECLLPAYSSEIKKIVEE